jgi:hypothetical protein
VVPGGSGGRLGDVELLIARNPDPDSRLPYLLWLPLAGGMVFRTSGKPPTPGAAARRPVRWVGRVMASMCQRWRPGGIPSWRWPEDGGQRRRG